jgi:cytochrome c oxidase subunit II
LRPRGFGETDVKKFWVYFFIFWPIVAIALCVMAPWPEYNWWFPKDASGSDTAFTPIGVRIDQLFYLILIITTVVFIGTQIALGYVLWRGASGRDENNAWFSHGSHNLEVIWTIVPAGILLFISLYQMDTWADYRVKSMYPEEALLRPVAEVTARQFEWRIRYPSPDRKFKSEAEVKDWLENPKPNDLYTVNDLHVRSNEPVVIHLRSGDVQHSFFAPKLRVKQDAVPGLVIPILFEVTKAGEYELLCAELCGWGHYKMGARIQAETPEDFEAYLRKLQTEQNEDGVPDQSAAEEN